MWQKQVETGTLTVTRRPSKNKSRTKSLTVQKQDKLSAFGFRLHQSSNICTGKKYESWKYIRVSKSVQVKSINHENTQNQRKCVKIDTMYNSYEVNFSQIHIKLRKRNWKSSVNGPSLNLKLKMAAKIRRVHLWRFVGVWLNVCTAPHHTAPGKIQYQTDGKSRILPTIFVPDLSIIHLSMFSPRGRGWRDYPGEF